MARDAGPLWLAPSSGEHQRWGTILQSFTPSVSLLSLFLYFLRCTAAMGSLPGIEYDYGISPKFVCTPIPPEADPSCYSPPIVPHGPSGNGHSNGHDSGSRRGMMSDEAKTTILHLRESLVRQKETILDQRETIRELTAKLTLCEGFGGHSIGNHNNHHNNHRNNHHDSHHESHHGSGSYHPSSSSPPLPSPHHGPSTHHDSDHHYTHSNSNHRQDPHARKETSYSKHSTFSVEQTGKTLQALKERLENLQARNSSSSYSSSLRDLLQRKINALEEQLHNHQRGLHDYSHHNDHHSTGHPDNHHVTGHYDDHHSAGNHENHPDSGHHDSGHHNDHRGNNYHVNSHHGNGQHSDHNTRHHDNHHSSHHGSHYNSHRYTRHGSPNHHHYDWHYGRNPSLHSNHHYDHHAYHHLDAHHASHHESPHGLGNRDDQIHSNLHDNSHHGSVLSPLRLQASGKQTEGTAHGSSGHSKLEAVLSHLHQASSDTGTHKKPKSPDAFHIGFPMRTNYMYAKMTRSLVSETFALTVCLWLRGRSGTSLGTPFSYSVPGQANELVLIEWGTNPMELLINDKAVALPMSLTDGKWHHVCVTWSTRDGLWEAYQDGVKKGSGENLSAWHSIKPGGIFIIGQEQDTMGGRFDATQSFVGDMSDLQFWSRVLTPNEIYNQASCGSHLTGDIISWSESTLELHGGVAKYHFDPCH